jgi:hypothetical protein
MTYKNCNCNPPSVISSIIGDRCHIDNDRGEWCAIVNKNGIYLQTLLYPSELEIANDEAHKVEVELEQAANTAKENRIIELKSKLKSGQNLTQSELNELLSLII